PSAQRKQRAQGKPGARCTRSLACEIKIAHERSHHRFRRIQPGLPRAMVLTAYFVLSPATRLCCHRRLRIWYVKTRLGLRTSARLDASIGASELHDFTVRLSVVRPRAIRQLTCLIDPPGHPLTSPDAAASTA